MKKKILIVKNISHEGPGLLEKILNNYKINYNIIDLSRDEKLPTVNNYSAVIILGGPDSANDENEKMLHQLNFVKEILSYKIPYLGICLGLQVLVKAAGGKVVKCSVKEVGFLDHEKKHFTIDLTEKGKKDPLFDGLGTSFNVLHLHEETVELTNDMILIATGKFCKNQIVRIGKNAYGIQSHFELTEEMFIEWCKKDPDLAQFNNKELYSIYRNVKVEYESIALKLFENFLKIASFDQT